MALFPTKGIDSDELKEEISIETNGLEKAAKRCSLLLEVQNPIDLLTMVIKESPDNLPDDIDSYRELHKQLFGFYESYQNVSRLFGLHQKYFPEDSDYHNHLLHQLSDFERVRDEAREILINKHVKYTLSLIEYVQGINPRS